MAIHIRRSETHITMRDDQSTRRCQIKTDMNGVADLVVDGRVHSRFQIDSPVMDLSCLAIELMLKDVRELIAAKDWPVCGVVRSSDLGHDWTAEHHLKVFQDIVPRGCTKIVDAMPV